MAHERRAVREGLLAGDLADASTISLVGSECADCSEISLATSTLCLNCGSDELTPVALSNEGKIWTYTIVRHRPPGDFRGKEPFEPFPLGLVELAEGIRVMAPLSVPIDDVKIGMNVRFQPVLRDDNVVAFTYSSSEAG